ncbi:MAG TPA: PIN domain-containing protein [Candidatus Saccharimonadales bacterium]|nr:PIN domain-containing protein [Candidatus Saccharimonadales bacterium]
MSLWVIRIFFLLLCAISGYAVSQYRPEIIEGGTYGLLAGFGMGGILIGIDHIVKGFSLRAFTAATFGLLLGTVIAWLIDNTQLFIYADERSRWLMRLGLFLAFGYLGMIMAMRSNKEDFSLLIPYVRFRAQTSPSDNLLLLDTSAIIDGRVAGLLEHRFVEGVLVVPRFILHELQTIADSADQTRRVRGRRGLDLLQRLQSNPRLEVKIYDVDYPDEKEVDAKLIRLARAHGARLVTTDYNLGKVADLQSVSYLNLTEMATLLKPVTLPGDIVNLHLVREGRDKGQALAYLSDGTMVVVNQAQTLIGQHVDAKVTSLLQTGAGVIIFADLKLAEAA